MDQAFADELFSQARAMGTTVPSLASVDSLQLLGLCMVGLVLPALTFSQYKRYERGGEPDLMPLQLGLVSRRWLLENLLSLLYAVSLVANAVAIALHWTPPLTSLGFSPWMLAVFAAAAVSPVALSRSLLDFRCM